MSRVSGLPPLDFAAPLLSAPRLAALMVAGMLTACGGGSGGGNDKPPPVVSDTHTVTAEAGVNGDQADDSAGGSGAVCVY